MPTYRVIVIIEGRETDYYDYHIRNIKTNLQGEKLNTAMLGFAEILDAKNKADAAEAVRKKFPKNSIDELGIAKL